jgi:hypothetical protein
MWEKKVSGSNCPHCVNDLYMFSDAAGTWINAVNAEGGKGFAGHSDWRLPNVRELQSIVDYGRFTPATNPVFNNGINSFTVTEFYWSSTPAAINSSFAWQVNFLNGLIDAFDKNGTNNVRAVRGGR